MYASQVHNVHSVNRLKVSIVIAFENFFSECDHLLHGNVKSVAYSFEEVVDDMKVDNQYISINCYLQF